MPLTDIAVRNAKARERPYKLSDGGWLHLLVNPNGARLWRISYRWDGRQKTLSLGAYPAISLAEARKRRDTLKEQLARGIDPGQARKAEKRTATLKASRTFEAIAPSFYPAFGSFWRLDLRFRAWGAAGTDAEPFMVRSV